MHLISFPPLGQVRQEPRPVQAIAALNAWTAGTRTFGYLVGYTVLFRRGEHALADSLNPNHLRAPPFRV